MFLIISAAILSLSPALAETLHGHVTVTDADTVRFATGERIRLYGIDAPETHQQCEANNVCYECGKSATQFVQSLIGDHDVRCELTGDRTYGRSVATCFIGEKDIALAILYQGWAVTYRRYLRGNFLEKTYLAAESAAKSKQLGLFRGDFVEPRKWRRRARTLMCERAS